MSENRILRIPDLPGFELEYYYNKESIPQNPRIFPPHIHDMPEIYILTEGTSCFTVENRIYQLSAGDVVISRPNEMHHCILPESTVHRHLCFWFDPGFLLLEPLLTSCETSGNLISPSPQSKELLLQLYEELSRATEEKKSRLEFALVCRILCEIEEGIGNRQLTSPAVPAVLTEILEDINENFRIIDSLDYFTVRHYVSRSTLGRLFRIHLHTSPRMYLETKKMAYSRILLRKGASVSEACAKAGFSDVSGYIRLFRKRFGITPGEYKNR